MIGTLGQLLIPAKPAIAVIWRTPISDIAKLWAPGPALSLFMAGTCESPWAMSGAASTSKYVRWVIVVCRLSLAWRCKHQSNDFVFRRG